MTGSDVCRFGVLTASDRASAGDYDDLSGPAIERFLEAALTSPWEVLRRVVADEQDAIEAALVELLDTEGCSVVVTTGGNGTGTKGRDSRSHGVGLREDAARLRRADARSFPEARANCYTVPPDRWDSWILTGSKPPRLATLYP